MVLVGTLRMRTSWGIGRTTELPPEAAEATFGPIRLSDGGSSWLAFLDFIRSIAWAEVAVNWDLLEDGPIGRSVPFLQTFQLYGLKCGFD